MWNPLRDGDEWSQSPSIMECSPTTEQEFNEKLDIVAVPVNYGMLSYPGEQKNRQRQWGRSPRQLWNALLPCQIQPSPKLKSRSPRQLWNALLPWR